MSWGQPKESVFHDLGMRLDHMAYLSFNILVALIYCNTLKSKKLLQKAVQTIPEPRRSPAYSSIKDSQYGGTVEVTMKRFQDRECYSNPAWMI